METTTIQQDIAGRVNEAMHAAGFNPNKLANVTGIPRTTLNRMLNGHIQFGSVQLHTIAHHLGTTLFELVPDEDQPAA